jgi:hypothetical protein
MKSTDDSKSSKTTKPSKLDLPSSVDPRVIRRRRVPEFLNDVIGRYWTDGAWQ